MKLGISYPVFEGEELLEYTIKSIRDKVDFISVIYQEISYWGNPCSSEQFPILCKLPLDTLVYHKQDLSIHHRTNQALIRNMGIDISREFGCTHHISADVDEIYLPEQLEYAKQNIGDANCSIVELTNYYKRPTWRIKPDQGYKVSFIQTIDNSFDMDSAFPFHIETTRKPKSYNKIRVFTRDEFEIHHMTYVRKNIRRKMENSSYGRLRNVDKFVNEFDKYKLGDRLCMSPDFLNRKTVLAPNIFGIKEDMWEQQV